MKFLITFIFLMISLKIFADPGIVYHCSSSDSEWKLSAKIVPAGYSTIGSFTSIGPDFQNLSGEFSMAIDLINGREYGGSLHKGGYFYFVDKLGTFEMRLKGSTISLECELRHQDIPTKSCAYWMCGRGGPMKRFDKVLVEKICAYRERPNCI